VELVPPGATGPSSARVLDGVGDSAGIARDIDRDSSREGLKPERIAHSERLWFVFAPGGWLQSEQSQEHDLQ
jgi:hypothetical protein